MHLNDQVGCTTAIEFIASPFEQLKKIANRKCISPKVSLLIFRCRVQASLLANAHIS